MPEPVHLLRDAEPWAAVFVALLALASFILLLRESLPLPLLVGLAGLLGWLADGVGLV